MMKSVWLAVCDYCGSKKEICASRIVPAGARIEAWMQGWDTTNHIKCPRCIANTGGRYTVQE